MHHFFLRNGLEVVLKPQKKVGTPQKKLENIKKKLAKTKKVNGNLKKKVAHSRFPR